MAAAISSGRSSAAWWPAWPQGTISSAAMLVAHQSARSLSMSRVGEYRVVFRFDTGEHLRAWLDSDERAVWLERAEPHVAGPMRTQVLTGLESWFTLPTQPGVPPPPRYKMAVLTWATIFPLITLVVVASAPLIGSLPLVLRLAVTTGVTVPLMTWVVMPRVTRLLHRWLYPDRR